MNRKELVTLISTLKNGGQTVTVIPDLCKISISNTDQMATMASGAVVACYPRAVRSMFDNLGLKPKEVFDIRNHTGEQVLHEMGILHPLFAPEHPLSEFVPQEGEEAWHPVIDRERCTGCGKCYDFCLFGVYARIDGEVRVTQPQKCKNNCPACARVCPSQAVIFPKYEKSPINGGVHHEEKIDETDNKALYNTALKHKLAARRAKVSLLKNHHI